ncbi:MAG: 30S ribosomal protein S11 [Candidatus Ryanbacteria bacterium]|nr:30S ribosomal protein S11 [Candidatus Ryanbacteria bacterium]
MGKKRIIRKSGEGESSAPRQSSSSRRKLAHGLVHISATYNNTLISLTDARGNLFAQNSSGRMGFSGSKKGTPYAATKAAEVIADQAREMGVTDLDIRIKGLGSGRESALRVFGQKGFAISSIRDMTPIPHGIPRLKKPRRV